jgi:hypothetical protein
LEIFMRNSALESKSCDVPRGLCRDVPPGRYSGEFLYKELVFDYPEVGGFGLRLVWRVNDGEHAGKKASRTFPGQVLLESNFNDIEFDFSGGQLAPRRPVTLGILPGSMGDITVEPCGEDGRSTRVALYVRT